MDAAPREHSAIGDVTPRDKLLGLESEIWAERERKLEDARGVLDRRRVPRLHARERLEAWRPRRRPGARGVGESAQDPGGTSASPGRGPGSA